ncbi:MAG TPA: VOC family protein [Chloroflexota bacterium]|jgi:catechol 2,3-dioxygenase-like lactoylglutathione lyase family enzyme
MPKIRHIAYRAEDVDSMANFFVSAFEMEIVERRTNGAIDVSDGTINITVLPMNTGRVHDVPVRPGIEHIGFSTLDDTTAKQRVTAAGGKELQTINMEGAHFEVKFQGPEGIVVDIGSWAGTAPVEEPATAAR